MDKIKSPVNIKAPSGKLGVLLPGMGAVATTFIAGVLGIKKGFGLPIGSLTQMGTIRIGERADNNFQEIKSYVPLVKLESLEFGGWDIFEDSCYESACKAGVLENNYLNNLKDELENIKPFRAVFDRNYVKKLNGTYIKNARTKMDYAKMLMEDIQKFKEEKNLDRLVAVWCGSTEVYIQSDEVHKNLENFEKGLETNNPRISPSMIYAYACLRMSIPYCNGAPNLGPETGALIELANEKKVPISGKDFKTGQTLMKTILAPGFKARMLGIKGWFSTNILGNRDGEVLDCSESFKSKEVSKLSVLDTILQKEQYPEIINGGWANNTSVG